MAKQIDEINRKRTRTNPEDISFGLRHKWFSPEYVVNFLRENGYPNVKYGKLVDVEVGEDALTGKTKIKKEFQSDYDNPFGEYTGIEGSGFPRQFLNYLNGGNVTSSGEDAQERITAYKNQCRVIEENFGVWMKQSLDIDHIGELYNIKFNSIIQEEHSGDELGLKGVSPQVKLHDYQNSAIRRMSEEGRGCLGFDVGLGKTLSALGLSQYNMQMGRSKRTCIVVPDSVLANWYHSAKQFFGKMDDVLTVGFEIVPDKSGAAIQEPVLDETGNHKKNKHTGEYEYQDKLVKRNSKEDVFSKMWEIPTTSKRIVIMSKEKFAMIPMMPETKGAYVKKMTDKALISMANAAAAVKENSAGVKTGVSYADDIKQTNLEQQYSDEGTKKKGELPYYEMMGFTDVIVDEAHCFPYDTEIMTIDGPLPIGEICEKNIKTFALSRNIDTDELSYQPITGWMAKKLFKNLVKVEHEHGHFVCTIDHLIWTKEGAYIEARDLDQSHTLQILRKRNYGSERGPSVLQSGMCGKLEEIRDDGNEGLPTVRSRLSSGLNGQCQQKEKILRYQMLSEMEDESAGNGPEIQRLDGPEARMPKRNKISGIFRKDESEQPDVQSSLCGANEGVFEGTEVPQSRREREIVVATANAFRGTESPNRISNSDKGCKAQIRLDADMLQSRSGNTRKDDCNRDRRIQPQVEIYNNQRHEEISNFVGSRVVSVTVLERRDFERHGIGSFEDTIVYDVEVAENHNFYADGVLAHNCFKNSYQGGENTSQIAYLPTAPSAKRALDMNMKMNFIRDSNSGRGAYLLTATPVTNSPFEIYNMLSLVCPPEEFEKFGVYTIDDFVRVFGEIVPVDKMCVSGEIKSKDGLIGFQNLGGLRSIFHKYVNMKDAEDVNLVLPPHEEVNDDVELTDEQKELYEILRVKAHDAMKPGKKAREDTMFAVIRDMDRVTTDMDLYHKKMTFVFPLASRGSVDDLMTQVPKMMKIKSINEDTNEKIEYERELVFETKTEGDKYVLSVPEEYETHVVTRLQKNGIKESDVTHPLMPKYAKLVANMQKEIETGGKQLVFTEEKTQHEKIMRIMVHNLPMMQDKIGIINAETASGGSLQGITDSYNSGKLAVVICNKKAEVGVNLQKGTTAIHHLTLPWTPASIQQRNGRGVRQGNTAAHINIYYYLGKGSFDVYRLDLLKKKASWMKELFNGKTESAQNANADNADDMMDLLAANPEEAKQRRLERLEEKKNADKAREDKRLINQLSILASASKALSGIDVDKNEERIKLDAKLQEYIEKMNRHKEGVASATTNNDTERLSKLADMIVVAQRNIEQLNARLSTLDAKYEKKRQDLDSRVKQISGVLRGNSKKGSLPFSETLIDKPEQCIVSLSGQVIAIGDMFEPKDYPGTIQEVTAVNAGTKTVEITNITAGYNTRGYTKGIDVMFSQFTKVSYSKSEIDELKLLAKTHEYKDLLAYDKEFFIKYQDRIKYDNYDDMPYELPDGSLVMSRKSRAPEGARVLFPEPNNEAWRKRFCMFVLKARGDVSYRIQQGVLGDGYQAIVDSYGSMATETEILTVCASVYNEWATPWIAENSSAWEMNLQLYRSDFQSKVAEALSHFDNVGTIGKVAHVYMVKKLEELKAAAAAEKAEEEKKALEALKASPDYKEIPQEIADGFAKIGITVRTNPGNISLSVSRFKSENHKPFSRWFFHDSMGMSGRLYSSKEVLKARYGAKYFKNEGDFTGSWWHIPSTTDLKDIFNIVS